MTLGARFLAAGGRWAPGMLALETGDRVLRMEDGYVVTSRIGYEGEHPFRSPQYAGTPDMTDAATLGCVLAQVREAYGVPTIWVECETPGGPWLVLSGFDGDVLYAEGTSEAEALVCAMEARVGRDRGTT